MYKHGTPSQDQEKFFGNYRAIVVDNIDKDEDGNPVPTGRVKVRVPSIHGDNVPDEALPWAIYSDPFMGGLEDVGGFLTPNKDAKVWVFFEEGDHDQPVYFAGAPSKPHMPVEKDVEDYPNNKVFKTKAGFVIEIDDSEEDTRLRVYQPSGNEKVSDHEGNVEETIVGNVNRTIAGTLTVDIEGKAIFRAPEIQLGEDSKIEQSVLGKQLEDYFNDILKPYIDSHQHVDSMGQNTTPPIEPHELNQTERGGSAWSKVNTNQ